MNNGLLVRRLLAGKRLQNILAAAVMALCVALAVSVLLLAAGLHSGLTQAAKPFPMLMGAKGSPNQLVLNSVFLKDQPVGNIPYAKLAELRRNKNVAQATPLAFGDNYRGYRLVGAERDIFQLAAVGESAPWLQLAQGRAFAGEGEAVLGAEAARGTGLKLGDTFASVHGVTVAPGGRTHAGRYKVVGVLREVNGPYDSAVLVDIQSVWRQHKYESAAEERQVTAIVARPRGYAEALQLSASYSKNSGVQFIFPSKTVIKLFAIMGNVEKLLQLLALAVTALALLIIGGSLYWLMLGSLRQQGVMRALGATTAQINRLYFALGMTLVAAGLVGGVLLGHGVYALAGRLLRESAGLYLPFTILPAEGVLAIAILALGAFCSWLPVYLLGKRDVAEYL